MRSINVLLPTLALWSCLAVHPALAGGPDRGGLVTGNTKFALDFYHQASAKTGAGNIFFSPYSISSALAMTYAGARGQTAQQMAAVLRFDLDSAQLHPAFATLSTELNAGGPQVANQPRPYELSIANAIWGQNSYPFLPVFEEQLRRNYNARLTSLDFVTAPEPSRKTINDWVAQQTKDKIKDLLPAGVITPDTRMVLTNAVYFKSDWTTKFTKEQTQPGEFNISLSKKVQAPLMHQVSFFRYAENEQLQAVELPYRSNQLSLVVLLPKQIDGLAAMERTVTADALAKVMQGLARKRVDLTMPKFKSTSAMSLNDTLKSMGMTLAFSNSADFTGMSSARELYISDVIHKAYIDLDENGTEAAAATAVTMSLTSLPIPPTEPPTVVRIDRPFMYLIRHNPSGTILFMGRISDPTGN